MSNAILLYSGNENELKMRYLSQYDLFEMSIGGQEFRCNGAFVNNIISAINQTMADHHRARLIECLDRLAETAMET